MARDKYKDSSEFVRKINLLADLMRELGVTMSVVDDGNFLFTVGNQKGFAVDAEDFGDHLGKIGVADHPVAVWPPACEVKYLVLE